jgi:polyketide cyclase/dehydrase/lipid transport protein
MAPISVSAERTVGAPAPEVYGYIADHREHHAHFLPPAFSDFQVTRQLRTQVAEPEPGRVLTESDTLSSSVTTWTLTPEGSACQVRISTTWQGAGGVGGVFERLFAPRVLRRLYADELSRLDAYARERRGAPA